MKRDVDREEYMKTGTKNNKGKVKKGTKEQEQRRQR